MPPIHDNSTPTSLRPLTDLRKVRPLKRLYLVEGVILKNDEMCIYGLPGTCKSATAASFVTAITHDKPWFGRAVRGGATLTIACEGADGWSARMRAAQLVQDIPEDVDAKHAQFHYKWPVNFLSATSKQMLVDSVKSWMRQEKTQELALVVIDTVSRVIPGADQNSAGALEAFNTSCMEIKEALGQPAILSIHHSDKKGRSSRGSNALEGGLNALVKVDRNKSKSKITLNTDKDHRDGVPFEKLELAIASRNVQVWNEECASWEPQSSVCVSANADDLNKALEIETNELFKTLDLSNAGNGNGGRLATDCQRLLELLEEAGDEGERHSSLRKATPRDENETPWGEDRFNKAIQKLKEKELVVETAIGNRGRQYALLKTEEMEASDDQC